MRFHPLNRKLTVVSSFDYHNSRRDMAHKLKACLEDAFGFNLALKVAYSRTNSKARQSYRVYIRKKICRFLQSREIFFARRVAGLPKEK